MEREVNKTAVEWLEEQIKNNFDFTIHNKLFDILGQAKEIEKQQIIEAFENGYELDYFFGNRYYNETYENPKS